MNACPLCLSKDTTKFFEDDGKGAPRREYWRCPECCLIFVPSEFHLTAEEQRERYRQHRNDPRDAGYIEFLRRLADPVLTRITAGDEGLDYGCGPGPAMQTIFRKHGFSVENYDPHFFPDEQRLERPYDFIVCSETAEHFASPRAEFERLMGLLRPPRSVLGVMTRFLEDENAFSGWWYRRDPTHVAFYQRETFEWISRWQNWSMEIPRADVVLFYKGEKYA